MITKPFGRDIDPYAEGFENEKMQPVGLCSACGSILYRGDTVHLTDEGERYCCDCTDLFLELYESIA